MRKHPVLIFAVLIMASITLLSGVASAREGIHKRIANQQHRINQGVTSGSLSRSEAEILQGNLDYVRDTFTKAKADGRITIKEEKRLHGILDQNNKMINQKEHYLPIRRLYQPALGGL